MGPGVRNVVLSERSYLVNATAPDYLKATEELEVDSNFLPMWL